MIVWMDVDVAVVGVRFSFFGVGDGCLGFVFFILGFGVLLVGVDLIFRLLGCCFSVSILVEDRSPSLIIFVVMIFEMDIGFL